MYEAEDGSLFKVVKEALKRNKMLDEMKALKKLLGGDIKDKGCNFANGDGFVQLSESDIKLFDTMFLKIVEKYEPWILKNFTDSLTTNEQKVKSYGMGRSLDDSGSPLYSLVSLRHCVDHKFRRWGQPYFAINPTEGKQVEWKEK